MQVPLMTHYYYFIQEPKLGTLLFFATTPACTCKSKENEKNEEADVLQRHPG